eukprot:6803408-Pyramimonas_sp.AAC.1
MSVGLGSRAPGFPVDLFSESHPLIGFFSVQPASLVQNLPAGGHARRKATRDEKLVPWRRFVFPGSLVVDEQFAASVKQWRS